MSTYSISLIPVLVGGQPTHFLKVGFGAPADNSTIVRDAESQMIELKSEGGMGGRLVLINGPASLPVAVVLAHSLLHIYAYIGVFDPKMQAYVVAASHGGDYAVGDLILAAEVQEIASA